MEPSPRTTLAIAGATGYIGLAACRFLAERFRVIGLTRRSGPTPEIPGVEWRTCDLFSYLECERVLEGVDAGLYLVHSMIPSARLTQGTFQDMDLILADNFARAAKARGLKQILYLGGLVPGEGAARLSRHLESRLEVERTLGSHGVPLTSLRASIVVGPHGSSFAIFRTLLERVPLLPCPRWGKSLTQPAALREMLELFRHCLEHPEESIGTFDVGCPEVVSYRQLLEITASTMGLRRRFLDVPLQGSIFCKLWLCAVTGAPMALVAPLVESMRYSMVTRDRRLQAACGLGDTPLMVALAEALAEEQRTEAPPVAHPPEPSHYDVRSVQRLPLPPGCSARCIADRYIRWLPWLFRWILRCEEDAERNVRVSVAFLRWRWTLLELTFRPDRNPGDDRQVYFITGGALVRKVDLPSRRPRLEFREVLDRTAVLMALHDFRPALPPWLYAWTQAKAHVLVTKRFGRYLRRMAQ
jgi:uncharacterized protein YbjT (DUF2867 family)